jgi:glycosyltransferase involved in cell wall biosynthesis
MHPHTHIAYVKLDSFSFTNDTVFDLLTNQFPDYTVQMIDLWDIVPKRHLIHPANVLCALLEHGRQIATKNYIWPHRVSSRLLKTSWFFTHIQQFWRRFMANTPPAFTFQTNSIFDASLPGIPHFLYTDHSLLVNLRYPGIQMRDIRCPWLEYERDLYHRTTVNFTWSEHIARSLIHDYGCPPERVAVVGAGGSIPVDAHADARSERYRTRTILFVGVDWERKGGPELEQAFRQVLQVYPDAQLTIIGCSPRLNVPNCTVLGRRPPEETIHHYKQSSIFCMPTRLEPFGKVYIEASAYGLPVVATTIGAVPEIIQHEKTGFLVEPYDSQQLATYLITLLGNPELCAMMGARGRAWVQEQFTWERTGAAIRDHIHRSLIGTSSLLSA